MDRPDELNSLEHRLGSLRPSPLAIDRDRLMYLAGRATAETATRGRFAAVAFCVGLSILCVGLATRLSAERGQRLDLERVVAEQRREPVPERFELVVTETRPAPSSYYALTHLANETGGLTSLPTESSPPPSSQSTTGESPLSPLSARRLPLAKVF